MGNIQKDGPYSWFYLTATCLVSFTFIGVADSTGIFVAVFIEHLNESNAKGGWIGSMIFVLGFALAPVTVYVHGRVGFRWCMFIASVLYTFSLCVTPFMTDLNVIFLTYSIPLGFSLSLITTLSVVTQREYFSKYFGLAVGLRFSANAIGAVVVSFILPIVLAELGYKMTFISLLIFAPMILCYGLIARHHVHQDTELRKRGGKSTINLYKEFLQDKSFTTCLVAIAMFFSTCFIPTIFLVRYAVTLGHPLSKAKWLLVVRGLATFVTRAIVACLGDMALKHGKVKTMAGFTFVSFGVLNFVCSFIRSFPLLLVYMALIGIVEGVWWVLYSLLAMEITGGYFFNQAFSLCSLIGALALLVATPLSGWIFDQTNDFRYVFYTAFGMSMLAAITLSISSHLKVDKEFSLIQKSKLSQEEVDINRSLSECGIELVTKYETAV